MRDYLVERVSFRDLVRVSEPKRVARSRTVRGPPLRVDAYKNAMYYGFNFKSYPSTTGLRHKGYIKFFRPRRNMSLLDVECEVDCSCFDFRYRWAWVDKQLGSSRVGPRSLNQAWNQAPVITNPAGRPGLCKHLLAVRDYIKGQTSSRDFIGTGRDAGIMLNQLVNQASRFWLDPQGNMQKAREREKKYRDRTDARRRGEAPPLDEPPPTDGPEDLPSEPPPSPPLPGNQEGPMSPSDSDLDAPPDLPPEDDEGNEDDEGPLGTRTESVGRDDKQKSASMKNFNEMVAVLEDIEKSMVECDDGAGSTETPEDKGEELLQLLRDIKTEIKTLNQTNEPPVADEPPPVDTAPPSPEDGGDDVYGEEDLEELEDEDEFGGQGFPDAGSSRINKLRK